MLEKDNANEYVLLDDVKKLCQKLISEPGYQHCGEDFYAGVSEVYVNLSELPKTCISDRGEIWEQ
jgi:hypothetical protein